MVKSAEHDIENRAKSNNIDLKASKAKYKELNFDKDKIRLLLEIESYGFDMRLYEQVKYDFGQLNGYFDCSKIMSTYHNI